ncbi:spore germination protein (amino acid permease) [Thermosyntropha lipolytica DSM 11003]|uniref:Spore germination protein (Amino acid permease) n=1 Tax=Thermosyntropha lipolytica DSM 11003 TaxID=1123382 RepID=A0A1M5NLQ0_9FIRM|nr:GerAB/ArcD/ProY family transporter [Thermosyntropha lipolytica]SHG90119.1 spore germination protein (amino acid permease) [Thermosyntropha lipolytica DSM 11003]
MDKSRFEITSKQLIFIIVGSEVATGILSLPRVLSAEAGQHAWIAVLTGALVPLICIYLIDTLYRGFDDPDFVRVSHALFGKALGSLLVITFILYIIFFQGIVIRIFAEITKIFLLPRTPLYIILFLILLPVYYAVSKGGRVVGRLNEILFWILLIDLLVLLVLLPLGDYTLLLPLKDLDYKGLLKATRESFYSYAGVEILLILYVMVRKKEEVFKAAIVGQFIVIFFYLVTVVIALLIFGFEAIQQLTWPVLNLLSVRHVAVLERLEIVFLLFWLGVGARPAINLSLASAYSFCRLGRLSLARYYVLTSMGIALAIYLVAIWPRDLIEVFQLANYAGFLFLLTSLGYPLLYHIAKFMRKGVINHGKTA